MAMALQTSPGAARACVDVEVTATTRIELQTTHRWLSPQPAEHGRLVASDAEVGCIASQVLRMGRAPDLSAVASAAAAGVDLHETGLIRLRPT